jgi:hypothetical protein
MTRHVRRAAIRPRRGSVRQRTCLTAPGRHIRSQEAPNGCRRRWCRPCSSAQAVISPRRCSATTTPAPTAAMCSSAPVPSAQTPNSPPVPQPAKRRTPAWAAPENPTGGAADLQGAEQRTAPRAYATLPAWAMAAGRPAQLIDARVLDDALWLLRTYRLRVTAAREGGHNTHGDGTALDVVPAEPVDQDALDRSAGALARDLGWTPACGASPATASRTCTSPGSRRATGRACQVSRACGCGPSPRHEQDRRRDHSAFAHPRVPVSPR